MKTTGKCPKCDSTNIASKEIVIPIQGMLRLSLFRRSASSFAKGSIVQPYVCLECGYTEFFTEDVQKLRPPKTMFNFAGAMHETLPSS